MRWCTKNRRSSLENIRNRPVSAGTRRSLPQNMKSSHFHRGTLVALPQGDVQASRQAGCTILRNHNIDAINPHEISSEAIKPWVRLEAGTVGIAPDNGALRFHPLRSDDDATNGNANWHARCAHLWNGGA